MNRKNADWARAGLMVLGSGMAPAALYAQSERPVPTTAACNAMIYAVSHTPLPAAGDSAWRFLNTCNDAGTAFAIAIGNSITITDSGLLAQFLQTASLLVDSMAFDRFTDVARNSAATPKSRAMAFEAMLIYSNYAFELDHPIATVFPNGQNCTWTTGEGIPPTVYRRLASNYREQIANAARVVYKNPSQPASVVAAARCTMAVMNGRVLPDVTTSLLTLTYVCGNTFRLNNANPDAADVRYTVETTETAILHVPAGKSFTFFTTKLGSVHLAYRGTEFATVSNDKTTCP
jgi:hypothetical protein